MGCLWPLPVLCRRLWCSVIVEPAGISAMTTVSYFPPPLFHLFHSERKVPCPLGEGGRQGIFIFSFSSETSETGWREEGGSGSGCDAWKMSDGLGWLTELFLAASPYSRGGAFGLLVALARSLQKTVAQCNCGTRGNSCRDYPFSVFTAYVSPVSLRNESPVPLGEGGEARYIYIFFFK